MADDTPRTSTYLEYLPALYREEETGRPSLLIGLLRAFEQVFTGRGDPQRPGLEEMLEGIVEGEVLLGGAERYFRPGPDLPPAEQAPFEFLDWLSGWVALTLRDNWEPDEQRRILREAVASYHDRGTRVGLQRMVAAYVGLPVDNVVISERLGPLQVGIAATVGEDTALGDGGPPHFFWVHVRLLAESDTELVRRREILRAIIDAEKPAHTYYSLTIEAPTLQVGIRSTVGIDTFLGTPGVTGESPGGEATGSPGP